jgi:AcrR family transcriptional regulator
MLAGTVSDQPETNDAAADGAGTRQRILRAAEELFALRGIDGVSLREINRAAGGANAGAVQYYFGDREGLVVAVLSRHRADEAQARHALLDAYELAGRPHLRGLADALVRPVAAKLSDPDGGRHFLQIAAEYYVHARYAQVWPPRIVDDSVPRWHALLNAVADTTPGAVAFRTPSPEALDLAQGALHARFPAVRFTLVELARRAASPPRPDDDVFVSYLVDLVTSLLATQPSAETRDQAGEPPIVDRA